jgi:N-acetylglucosamine-6-phosphate deacetylase
MLKAFINSVLFTGEELLKDRTLIVDDDRIRSITDDKALPSAMEIIDCKGNYLAPGLLDLQIAGGGGYLFSSFPTKEALESITSDIVSTGTTGFLITLPTNTFEVYGKAFRAVKEFMHPALLGIHLEGPFLSMAKKGAHMEEYIKVPQADDVKALIDEAGGTIKMMTIAPEVCNPEIIEILVKNGIIVAAGHSSSTLREASDGFSNGIRTTTHLFNAMSPLHHRDPGLPGAVFHSSEAFASIIADGIHVDFNMVMIAKKIMGERLFLVSDAVEENLIDAYQHVRQSDRFTLPDGTLSGSILTMLSAVKNCVLHAGISVEEALRMASTYPARVMKYDDRGRIEPGYRADLIIFSKEFDLQMVIVDGQSVENILV